ncbi:MAG TPA: flagellar biosynthesis anti-sigma factor FlgM [Chitinispirillaceae bacterium]|nr:flagellar biosynthesis anti-sigma factor FlgM [Chitinispirillaceae bacterium]
MRINAVTQPFNAELRKIENSRKAEKESKNNKLSDRSDISSSAQSLSETKSQHDAIAASITSLPEIRNDKISEVRSRIENGYYSSEEFLDKLAEKLLNEFGLKNNEL